MGTKRALSPTIKRIIEGCRSGPFLDAFAGMCSIGSTIGPARPIWSNDLQVFSNTVAEALFCSAEEPRSTVFLAEDFAARFNANLGRLQQIYGDLAEMERKALASQDYSRLHDLFEMIIEKELHPNSLGVYDLFTSRYGGVYFSIQQTMEIDSIRAAIDGADADQITADQARWLLIATAIAMNRCTTSPGHFAQPVSPKRSNVARVVRERARSLLNETIRNFAALSPIGSSTWRAGNRVYSSDALTLLRSFSCFAPSVIYADPPYTDDQYSRFYHLYETWILYDYPLCRGRGRYRQDRAVSNFSLASKVSEAIEDLISSAAALSADLVLSYPTNGLLDKSAEQIPALIRSHYGRDPKVHSIAHRHSTMGGSKGAAAAEVVECIYRIAA